MSDSKEDGSLSPSFSDQDLTKSEIGQNGKVEDQANLKPGPKPLSSVRSFLSGKKGEKKESAAGEQKFAVAADGVSGFIERLVRKGIVTQKSVDEAIAWKKTQNGNEKRRLFQILIEVFDADREKIYSEFANYYSFKTLDLGAIQLGAEKLSFINKAFNALPPHVRQLATNGKILPYQVSETDATKLQIITPDPANPEIPTIARAFPFQRHEVIYVSLSSYEELWRELTLDKQNRPAFQSVDLFEEDDVISELDEEIRKGHLAEIVDNIFHDAVRVNASDIHIIPKGGRKTEIHFRVDGHLTVWQTLDDIRADAIAAVVKDQAKGLDRFERNMAQDGFAQKVVDNKIVRFRVSIIPIIGRELKVKLESIVIRVLSDPESNITIENIGFQPYALDRFKKAIEKPNGIIILTGPTGSGKSTTLLAALRSVMDPSLNIVTVEDPVEYLIDGARQVKLNPKLDFEGALRAILRHDPDIVMVGEIRDRITADMAIKLANTGHLTFSTLHTNDAPSVIARLYKMGLEPFLLAYAINIIVAQRLLRKLCERCKAVDTEVLPITLEKIGFPKEEIASTTFYRPVGCTHCVKGYKGRTAIHEVLYFTREIRQLIMEAGSAINEEAVRLTAIKQGMQTLRLAGMELLKKGITTIEEVASTTTDD